MTTTPPARVRVPSVSLHPQRHPRGAIPAQFTELLHPARALLSYLRLVLDCSSYIRSRTRKRRRRRRLTRSSPWATDGGSAPIWEAGESSPEDKVPCASRRSSSRTLMKRTLCFARVDTVGQIAWRSMAFRSSAWDAAIGVSVLSTNHAYSNPCGGILGLELRSGRGHRRFSLTSEGDPV